jgi:26S proteasome regulatory subunit N10
MTKDFGKILAAVHNTKISGTPNFSSAIQIAQLALKHRQNKLQKQHIIVFIASPIEESPQALVRLAKKMKKNNISIDIINFGEEAVNTSKLEAFMEAIGTETSHLVTIPPGSYLLSDMLVQSPILIGEDGVPPPGLGAGMGDASGFEFGIDPSLDPELALALRMSLEEENARQEAEAQRAARETGEGLETVPEGNEKKDEDGEDGTGGNDMHVE